MQRFAIANDRDRCLYYTVVYLFMHGLMVARDPVSALLEAALSVAVLYGIVERVMDWINPTLSHYLPFFIVVYAAATVVRLVTRK